MAFAKLVMGEKNLMCYLASLGSFVCISCSFLKFGRTIGYKVAPRVKGQSHDLIFFTSNLAILDHISMYIFKFCWVRCIVFIHEDMFKGQDRADFVCLFKF